MPSYPPTKIHPDIDKALAELYDKARLELGYNSVHFPKALQSRGGIGLIKHMLSTANPSTGFLWMMERDRPDLTLEGWLIDHPEFHDEFTPVEINRANYRLLQYQTTKATP